MISKKKSFFGRKILLEILMEEFEPFSGKKPPNIQCRSRLKTKKRQLGLDKRIQICIFEKDEMDFCR